MDKRQFKRSIISLIYATILLVIIYGIYLKVRHVSTCFDGMKNQNEEGVDCGGVCQEQCSFDAQDLIVGKMGVVPAGIAGKYDFYVQITNPNATFGNKNFYYSLNFKNSAGDVLASRKGSNFILPGERKYVIESNIDSVIVPTSFDFAINSSDWVEFNDYYEKPDLEIVNKNYSEVSGGVGFSEAYGLLKNKSNFDFDLIKVEVILKDDKGNVLALNSTQMSTVAAGEQRDFRISWPNSFPGTVGNMEAQAEVDIFNSDTFLKRFYKAEKFQQY